MLRLLRIKLGYLVEILSDKQGNFLTVDGSLSDTAVSSVGLHQKGMDARGHLHPGQRGGAGNAAAGSGEGGLGKKSNSTSQLSAAGKTRTIHLNFFSLCKGEQKSYWTFVSSGL